MSRLCRLKTATHGEDGKWAYDEITSLRAQLAEVTRERDEHLRSWNFVVSELEEQARLNGMGAEREAKLLAQIAAAQAHIGRLTYALSMPCDRWNKRQHEIVKEALSTPLTLDALHDDRAATLLGAANHLKRIIGGDGIWQHEVEDELEKLAAAHRANKEGK